MVHLHTEVYYALTLFAIFIVMVFVVFILKLLITKKQVRLRLELFKLLKVSVFFDNKEHKDK